MKKIPKASQKIPKTKEKHMGLSILESKHLRFITITHRCFYHFYKAEESAIIRKQQPLPTNWQLIKTLIMLSIHLFIFHMAVTYARFFPIYFFNLFNWLLKLSEIQAIKKSVNTHVETRNQWWQECNLAWRTLSSLWHLQHVTQGSTGSFLPLRLDS